MSAPLQPLRWCLARVLALPAAPEFPVDVVDRSQQPSERRRLFNRPNPVEDLTETLRRFLVSRPVDPFLSHGRGSPQLEEWNEELSQRCR